MERRNAISRTLSAKQRKQFHQLAVTQEGGPERAMLSAQFALMAGVLQRVIEDVGDLNNRMNKEAGASNNRDAGYKMVRDKVERSLRKLTSEYGFAREHHENMKANSDYYQIPLPTFVREVDRHLRVYADAHAKLPVSTMGQKVAQDAAVALGEGRFDDASVALERLLAHMDTVPQWVKFAWFTPIKQNPASIPTELAKQYADLALAQRGAPEDAMGEAQAALGGGVLNYVIEHVGDLNHRMNKEAGRFNHDAGYGYVKDKTEKSLERLKQPYGFRREHHEQMVSNAKYHGVPLPHYLARARKALAVYAAEHAALRVYTMGQKFAQMAAVALGEERFDDAASALAVIQSRLSTKEEWIKFAWFTPIRG